MRKTAFRHRYVVAVAANVAAGALLNLILGWSRSWSLPISSLLFNVCTFTAGGMAAFYLADTRRLPDVVLRALDKVQQTSLPELVRVARSIVTRYPVLIIGILSVPVWGALAPAVESLPLSVHAIYNATYTVGMAWLVLWLIWQVGLMFSGTPGVEAFLIGITDRFILLFLALLAVRSYGAQLAEMLASAKTDPDAALAFVAAFVVVRVVFAVAPSRSCAGTRDVDAIVAYAAKMRPRRERSAQDIHRTAIHEAGHLLLHAGRAELPPDLAVKVLSELGELDLYRGMVTHSGQDPDVLTEGYFRWLMLMNLAEAEAEFVALGERADGSSGDNSKWLNVATAYLTSGFGEVFYPDPEGESQVAHNRAVLNALKASCVVEVRRFLSANRALLEELAGTIVQQTEMNTEQIAPFLARAVNVEMLPRPD